MPPQTIDEVLTEPDQIIHRARNEPDRLGFFATLYRNVTIKVKEGIAAGLFEDGPRMEKLNVTFANRYLAAVRGMANQPRSLRHTHSRWQRCPSRHRRAESDVIHNSRFGGIVGRFLWILVVLH